MRRGMMSYNSYELYVKKLRLLLRKAKERYNARRLDFLKVDVKLNCKILKSLMDKNKKISPQGVLC